MRFYVGLHQPSDARHFDRCLVSFNRLRKRRGDFVVHEWMMDSGAFSEIRIHGAHRTEARDYADEVERWSKCGNMVAAVSQDWPCDPDSLKRTKLTVEDHQTLSAERYSAILHYTGWDVRIMPVLHGLTVDDYLRHMEKYRELLMLAPLVGVGSLVWRKNTAEVEKILAAIIREAPGLKLHGFGVKLRELALDGVRSRLWSCDSNAWSSAARLEGRNANDWREAAAYAEKITTIAAQLTLIEEGA